jgi:hypothetical protein
MKTESLHALWLDRELGELPPEAAELLDAWLAEHPESAAGLPALQRTLATAAAAVQRFPELARPESKVIAFPARRILSIPLALAASILILLGGTAWLGFRVGEESARSVAVENRAAPAIAPSVNSAKPSGPWARYALASNPRGGLTVVRRDTGAQP